MKKFKELFKKARFSGWIFLGVILMVISIALDPQLNVGWLSTTTSTLGKSVISSGLYYWVLRSFLKVRTHEIEDPEEKFIWQLALIIGVAIVFGLALIP